jgi:predicted DNA-binding transcriptional regulator AlpA
MAARLEFWRLPTVIEKVGLSRSEIYRRVADGRFPKPRHYPDSDKTFWLSSDVLLWQLECLGIETVCE